MQNMSCFTTYSVILLRQSKRLLGLSVAGTSDQVFIQKSYYGTNSRNSSSLSHAVLPRTSDPSQTLDGGGLIPHSKTSPVPIIDHRPFELERPNYINPKFGHINFDDRRNGYSFSVGINHVDPSLPSTSRIDCPPPSVEILRPTIVAESIKPECPLFGPVESAVLNAVKHKLNNPKTVFVVCSPGRCAIPEALLQNGAMRVIVLEPRKAMQERWRNLAAAHLLSTQRVEFHDYDFSRMSKSDHSSKMCDTESDFDRILGDVERVPFGEESNLCLIVGVMSRALEATALRYLSVKAMARQSVFQWGQVELYHFVGAAKALVLEGSAMFRPATSVRSFLYRYLFDVQHLTSVHGLQFNPPWKSVAKSLVNSKVLFKENYDVSKLYLFRLRPKHITELPDEEIPCFCFFARQFGLCRGKKRIKRNFLFPFLNQWVTGSSERVAVWNDQLTDRTMCRDLPLEDAIYLYRQLRQSPAFPDSPLSFETSSFAEQLSS